MKTFFTVGVLVLVFCALTAMAVAACGSLASEQDATKLLQTQGFRHIQLKNRDVWFVGVKGCGREDVALFNFRAINPIGRNVTVSVCEGWPFKGATVRQP